MLDICQRHRLRRIIRGGCDVHHDSSGPRRPGRPPRYVAARLDSGAPSTTATPYRAAPRSRRTWRPLRVSAALPAAVLRLGMTLPPPRRRAGHRGGSGHRRAARAGLYRLVRSGQPRPAGSTTRRACADRGGSRSLGQRRLLKWTVPGARARVHVLGLPRPDADDPRGATARCSTPTSHPGHRQAGLVSGSSRTCSPSPCCVGIAVFAVIRLRQQPRAAGPAVAVLRLAHRAAWLVLFMIFNVIWTLLLYRGAQIEHRQLPVPRRRRLRLRAGSRDLLAPLERRRQRRASRPSASCSQVGVVLGVPRASSSTPSTCTSSLAPLNVVVHAAARRARPAAADDVRRQARSTSRTRATTTSSARQDRGLHLEGPARLRHLHRVRSLPVAVPGLEHRQAAVAQAADHGPARPRCSPRRRTCSPAASTPTRPRGVGVPATAPVPSRARRRGRAAAGRPAAGRHR